VGQTGAREQQAYGLYGRRKEQRAIIGRLRGGGGDSLPAARLRPIADVTWFVDRAAAGVER